MFIDQSIHLLFEFMHLIAAFNNTDCTYRKSDIVPMNSSMRVALLS